MSPEPEAVSLARLHCFVAVIETRSFAAAARRLALTHSGVSKTIARLEAAHGVRLLHRSTHSVSPTDAGERLVGPARAVLEGAAEVDAVLSAAATGTATGTVRIGASPAFLRRRLVPLLPALAERHPGIVLDLRASDTFVDLAETGLDFAIRSGRLDAFPGHVRLPWFEFDWVVCASPGYLARRGSPGDPADLAVHDLIGFRNARTGLAEPWRLRDDAFPRSTPWALVTDDAETVLLSTECGRGIMWGPEWLARDLLARGALVEILPDWHGPRMPMSILRRSNTWLAAGVRAVIDFLRDAPIASDATN